MNRYTVLLTLTLVLMLIVAVVISYLEKHHEEIHDKWAVWMVIGSTVPGLAIGVYMYIRGPRPKSGG